MPLWTPWVDDSALDLTKPAVKQEPQSPSFQYPATVQAVFGYGVHSYPTVPAGHPAYYSGYSYTPDYMAVAQASPTSGESTCSGYEVPAPPALVISQSPQLPSPPDSPLSSSKRFCMDADTLSDDPDFQAFERDALRAMAEKNGGTLLGNNPKMRRAVRSTNQDSANDSYRKQRERNNFAAKQSRDRRKMREIHLSLKVSFLKKQVAMLKAQLAAQVCSKCQQQCIC